MQNDVNGIGWCLAEYFHAQGLKYLVDAQYRAHIPSGNQPAASGESPPESECCIPQRALHAWQHSGADLGGPRRLPGKPLQIPAKAWRIKATLRRTAFQFSGYITDNSRLHYRL